jgi:hypothetical protein
MRKVSEIREEMAIHHKEYQEKRWSLLSELWSAERLELNLEVIYNKSLTQPEKTPFMPSSRASF